MKYPNQRNRALLTGFLILTLLATSLVLPVSAAVRATRQHQGYQALELNAENGRVTDHDGRIGNSLRGADAAHHRHHGRHRAMNSLPEAARGVADGIRNATGDLARGAEDAADKVGQAAGDLARGADDAMRGENGTDGTMDQSIGNTPDNNNSSTEENGRGVIGWVIAILVVLAIALVVLAMLPKKSHERH